ncbi:MAG TPA: hypothetical protein VM658_18700 [bacterium]|nr:hypothetical protein [bacterium]
MVKNGIKVICNALWSIVRIPGINMTNAGPAEAPKTLTGDIKFDLTIQKGDENEREN